MNKVLIAMLAGVAIGILIAPGKGSETRKKLVDGFDDLKNSIQDEANELLGKGKDLVQAGKSLLEEAETELSI